MSTYSPPPKKVCTHAPSSTILPSALSGVLENLMLLFLLNRHLESTSSTAPSVLEREIPANMQPLCIQLGVSRGFTDVRLRVAGRDHQPLELPFVHMYAKYTWKWGWCAPSATSLFFNPDTFRCHKKGHLNM